jgi:hypothetical protein
VAIGLAKVAVEWAAEETDLVRVAVEYPVSAVAAIDLVRAAVGYQE